MLPFAEILKCWIPDVLVQEDKAPSHASKHQLIYFQTSEIERLIWPGNSLDLNMIESCWAHLKRVTTKKGPLSSRKSAEEKWKQAWEDLEQWRIQRWIERIPYHIQEVIRCEGGNEYQEGHPARSRQSKKKRQKEIKEKMHLHKQIQQKTYPLFKQATNKLSEEYQAYLRGLFCGFLDTELEYLDNTEWNERNN